MIRVAWGLVSVVKTQRGQCVHVIFRGGGMAVGKRVSEVRHPGVTEFIHCGVRVGIMAVETGFDRLLAEHVEVKKREIDD